MTDASKHKRELRLRRHYRVRKKVAGTTQRPRLAVFRSNRHISVQVIDDLAGKTVAAASTLEPAIRAGKTGNTDAASAIGKLVAERARQAGITSVVFDRAGYRYHGRVAAVAEGARQGGLEL